MTKLVVIATQGFSASGKTTWSLRWVAEDPAHRARVNRDALRLMLTGDPARTRLTEDQERLITAWEYTAIRAALRLGRSVVVDATNIAPNVMAGLRGIARGEGVKFQVQSFLHVSVDECIARDEVRLALGEPSVGAAAIRDQEAQYLAAKAAGCA